MSKRTDLSQYFLLIIEEITEPTFKAMVYLPVRSSTSVEIAILNITHKMTSLFKETT